MSIEIDRIDSSYYSDDLEVSITGSFLIGQRELVAELSSDTMRDELIDRNELLTGVLDADIFEDVEDESLLEEVRRRGLKLDIPKSVLDAMETIQGYFSTVEIPKRASLTDEIL